MDSKILYDILRDLQPKWYFYLLSSDIWFIWLPSSIFVPATPVNLGQIEMLRNFNVQQKYLPSWNEWNMENIANKNDCMSIKNYFGTEPKTLKFDFDPTG